MAFILLPSSQSPDTFPGIRLRLLVRPNKFYCPGQEVLRIAFLSYRYAGDMRWSSAMKELIKSNRDCGLTNIAVATYKLSFCIYVPIKKVRRCDLMYC